MRKIKVVQGLVHACKYDGFYDFWTLDVAKWTLRSPKVRADALAARLGFKCRDGAPRVRQHLIGISSIVCFVNNSHPCIVLHFQLWVLVECLFVM